MFIFSSFMFIFSSYCLSFMVMFFCHFVFHVNPCLYALWPCCYVMVCMMFMFLIIPLCRCRGHIGKNTWTPKRQLIRITKQKKL